LQLGFIALTSRHFDGGLEFGDALATLTGTGLANSSLSTYSKSTTFVVSAMMRLV